MENATVQPASFLQNVTSPRSFEAAKFFEMLTAKEFPEPEARTWVTERFPLTFHVSLAYVVVIFGTRFLMRNRPAFNLKVPLNAWNLFLAVFSILGTVNLTPDFFGTIWNDGLQNSYCKVGDYTLGRNGYWVWLFIVSKMFELVDTVFIVLRKKPLLFLHWYHHILTMVYAFFSYPVTPAFNRWGIYLNYFVHSYMYSYYFLRSMNIRVPGPIAKFVTTIQIWQFIVSVAILAHIGCLKYIQHVECELDSRVFALAVGMDISYLILFINFFLHAYVFRGGKDKYRSSKKAKVEEEQANGKMTNGTSHNEQNGHLANGATENGDVRKRNANGNAYY